MRRLPVLPPSPVEAWAGIYERADAAMKAKERAAEVEAGTTVPCRAGCAACCSKPALVERIELPSLAAAVADLPPEAQQRVRRRTAAWIAARRRLGVRGGPRTEKDPKRLEREGRALDEARIPCPLLEENRCLIYSRRPLTCRLHAVVGDPRLCTDPSAIVTFVDALPLVISAMEDAVAVVPDGRTESEVRFLPEWLRLVLAT